MNTHTTEKEMNIIKEFVKSKGVIRHPKKRFLVLIDGDINNLQLNNIAWTNKTDYMVGVRHSYMDARIYFTGAVEERQRTIKHWIKIGSIVPVITEGVYPEQTAPLPDTTKVNMRSLLGPGRY